MKFTVLGSTGFVGSNMVSFLKEKNIDVYAPDIRIDDIKNQDLGHIIYAIGISDFTKRPFETVEANVCTLKQILTQAKFDSLVFCSSTRIYQGVLSTNEEDTLNINPLQLNDLYNISKAMGESLCVASKMDNVRIARLSNVSGNNFNSELFLPDVIRNAITKNKITVFSSLESEKDYVYIDDVVKLLYRITISGKEKIYNVASGQNTKARNLVTKISQLTGCSIEENNKDKLWSFMPISTTRITSEFDFKPVNVVDKIEHMILSFKSYFEK